MTWWLAIYLCAGLLFSWICADRPNVSVAAHMLTIVVLTLLWPVFIARVAVRHWRGN
jgi:hypothetical protein